MVPMDGSKTEKSHPEKRKEVIVEETEVPDSETGFPAYMKGYVVRGRYIPINKKTWVDIEIDGNDSIVDCASQVVPLMIKKPSLFLTKTSHSSGNKKVRSRGRKAKNEGGENEGEEEADDEDGDDGDDMTRREKKRKKKRGKENSDGESGDCDSADEDTENDVKIEKIGKKVRDGDDDEVIIESDSEEKCDIPDSNKSTMLTIPDYYKSTVGEMLMGIGLSRSKEWYHKDTIRQLHRNIRKQGELDELVDELKKQQQYYNQCKAANSIFTFQLKKCDMCEFRTESEIVLDGHYSIPHISNRKEFKCNFCGFITRDPQAINYHYQNVHRRQCVIENPPLLYQCSICPYESSQKAKAATHIAKCLKFFNPDKVQSLPDPESEYPAITPKPITQEDIKVYEATLLALRNTALSPHAQLPNIPGLPRGLQQQMLLMQQQQVAQQSRVMRANKGLHGVKGTQNMRNVNYDLAAIGGANFAKSSAPQLYHMLQAGGHTQLVPLQPKYPKGVNSATHLQAVKGRVIPGSGGSALLQKSGRSNNSGDEAGSGVKGGTFVICEICDGYIKDLEQLRTHMQWIHKVKIHPKMLASRPPLNCQKCQWRFFTDQGLERHLLGAHGLVTSNMQDMVDQNQDGGRCTICGRISANKLVAHMNQVHKITLRPALLSYKCTVCSATFNLYRLFENHVYMVHSGSVKRNLEDQNQSIVKKAKSGLEPRSTNGTECHLKTS